MNDHCIVFSIEFRNIDHFYRIVHSLVQQAGRGKKSWQIEGKVLKYLKTGTKITRIIKVYNKDFKESDGLYLTLL